MAAKWSRGQRLLVLRDRFRNLIEKVGIAPQLEPSLFSAVKARDNAELANSRSSAGTTIGAWATTGLTVRTF